MWTSLVVNTFANMVRAVRDLHLHLPTGPLAGVKDSPRIPKGGLRKVVLSAAFDD
jgi:hypothetical protein